MNAIYATITDVAFKDRAAPLVQDFRLPHNGGVCARHKLNANELPERSYILASTFGIRIA